MAKNNGLTVRVTFTDKEPDRPSLRDERLKGLLRGKLLEQLFQIDLAQHVAMRLSRDGSKVAFTLSPRSKLGRQLLARLVESDVDSDWTFRRKE